MAPVDTETKPESPFDPLGMDHTIWIERETADSRWASPQTNLQGARRWSWFDGPGTSFGLPWQFSAEW
jgi:hypothetical protein